MEQNMIRIEQLSKRYKDKSVLDAISLTIKKGKIFLHKNEEAKAATEKDLEKFRQSMGSLIEEPAIYGTLSAWDNLCLHGKVCGNIFIDYEKIVELIDHENLKNKIEANHYLNGSVSGESDPLEEYFVKLVREGRGKCIS